MKKALALLLSLALVFGILGVASAEGSGKLTMLLDDATTQSNFDEYLAAAEAATGLDIEVMTMFFRPTVEDTAGDAVGAGMIGLL